MPCLWSVFVLLDELKTYSIFDSCLLQYLLLLLSIKFFVYCLMDLPMLLFVDCILIQLSFIIQVIYDKASVVSLAHYSDLKIQGLSLFLLFFLQDHDWSLRCCLFLNFWILCMVIRLSRFLVLLLFYCLKVVPACIALV